MNCKNSLNHIATFWPYKNLLAPLGMLVVWGLLSASVQAGICLETALGGGSSCTANDLETAAIVKFAGPAICVDGTKIYVQLQGLTMAGMSQRYDIGYFVSLDGGDALTGDCLHDYLPQPLTTLSSVLNPRPSPFFSADADNCGEPQGGTTIIRNIGGQAVASGTPGPPMILAIPCKDLDGVQPPEADLTVCTSWKNQSNIGDCNDITGAIPGNGSKCSCSPVAISGIVYKDTCTSDSDCNDNNLCTNDSCNTMTQKCVNTAVGPGTACDDGNPCTENDSCGGDENLTCLGTLKSCPGDQCNDGGSCDFATGLCNNVPKPNNTPCDDGETCTEPDFCINGVCGGTSLCEPNQICKNDECVFCSVNADCEDNNGCTDDICDPQAGCSNSPNNASCDDGDACTVNDTCGGGTCQAGMLMECTTPGDCESPNGMCIGGACVYPTQDNGTPCDDSDLCTLSDQCTNGFCLGTAMACTTPGICEEGAGACTNGVCFYQPSANNTPCQDGDACTINDVCMEGQCTSGTPFACDTPPSCRTTPGECIAGQCQYPNLADLTICGDQMVCQSGVCVFIAECDESTPCPKNDCLTESCVQGSCVYTPSGDGDPCGAGDVCLNGQCVECVDANDCPGTNACNIATCNPENTCTYAPAVCNGGNECSIPSCDANAGCRYAPSSDLCPEGDQCNDSICDINQGCGTLPVSGRACSDSQACTTEDTCDNGLCTGTPVSCMPPDTCSVSSCNEDSGQCAVTTKCMAPTFCDNAEPAGNCVQCNEQFPCEGNLVCSGGVCVGCNEASDCVNGSDCLLAQCVDQQCVYDLLCTSPEFCDNKVPKPRCVQCDDNFPCPGNLVCDFGVCIGCISGQDCTAGNECSIASCDNGACSYQPSKTPECLPLHRGSGDIDVVGTAPVGGGFAPLPPVLPPNSSMPSPRPPQPPLVDVGDELPTNAATAEITRPERSTPPKEDTSQEGGWTCATTSFNTSDLSLLCMIFMLLMRIRTRIVNNRNR